MAPNKDGLPDQLRDLDAVVLVLGSKGAGKGTFINKLIGNNAVISPTASAEVNVHAWHKDSQSTIYLVDTPGLPGNDVQVHDREILFRIMAWLHAISQRQIQLNGVVYLEPIEYTPLAQEEPSFFNLVLVADLIGMSAMKITLFATTKWDRIADHENIPTGWNVENAMELELYRQYGQGAAFGRFQNTSASAASLLHSILSRRKQTTLKAQKDLSERVDFLETCVGKAFVPYLQRQHGHDFDEDELENSDIELQEHVDKYMD